MRVMRKCRVNPIAINIRPGVLVFDHDEAAETWSRSFERQDLGRTRKRGY